jgi:predicted TIM-barrel fold metal-dependent hydrolase
VVIDAHTHPFGNRHVDLSALVKSKRDAVTLRHRHPAAFREFWSTREDETALLISEMDAQGIDMALIQPSVGEPVDGVVKAVRRNPDRLIGLFSIVDREILQGPSHGARPTRDTVDRFAEQVRHYVKDLGLRGCGELLGFSKQSAPELIAQDLFPLMEVLQEHRVPLMIPTAWTQFASSLYHGIPLFVDDLAERFPEVPILITKMGRGYDYIFEISLAIAFKHMNVYLDTAQAPARHIRRAVSEVGADRVVFGTDWSMSWRYAARPSSIYAQAFAEIDAAGLTAEEREWVMGRSAAQLFRIPSSIQMEEVQ